MLEKLRKELFMSFPCLEDENCRKEMEDWSRERVARQRREWSCFYKEISTKWLTF